MNELTVAAILLGPSVVVLALGIGRAATTRDPSPALLASSLDTRTRVVSGPGRRRRVRKRSSYPRAVAPRSMSYLRQRA